MAFFERKQYKVGQGKMHDGARMMDEEIIPLQTSTGKLRTGSFSGQSDDSVYSRIRRFETEAEHERLYRAVYGSEF